MALISLLALTGPIIPRPSAEFERTEYDLGFIQHHRVVRIQIGFKNTGQADLEIQKIETYCGCLNSFVREKIIPPGGEGILEIRFNSGDYHGQVEKYIYVYTSDPKNRVVEIMIKAFVINN
ncbi:MAG TPA: DUF1573 domain-containing protein [Spirochaetota bacterium]|nr:DUF1573 domain-containing protein [Spirochaetota bacterium]HPI90535.1 DUF1573 domain-containing protein [Spirochaetota bacterium]HPR47865.1 DUF1573 domain-containing protein [Spirochaetota bacterium]